MHGTVATYGLFLLLGYLLLICLKLILKRIKSSALENLPQPSEKGAKPFPIYHYGAVCSQPLGAEFLDMMRSTPNSGILLLKCLFGDRRLLLTSPQAVREVLIQREGDYLKPETARTFLHRLIGEGLLSLEGSTHRVHRKLINPSFQKPRVRQLHPLLWAKAKNLVSYLDNVLEKSQPTQSGPHGCQTSCEIDFMDWASRLSLDIIGQVCASHDFETLSGRDHSLLQFFETVFQPSWAKRVFLQINMILPQRLVMLFPSGFNRFMQEGPQVLHDVCRDFVTKRLDSSAKHCQTKFDGKPDFLDAMVQTGAFDEQVMIDHMRSFISVGHDSTASSVTWAIYLVSTHPLVQQQLLSELENECLGDEGDFSLRLERLPYLNAVCNEALRLYPALPITVREAIRETQILGTVVPKGTWIMISSWALNRLESVWGNDANMFRPDRWLDIDNESGTFRLNNHGGAPHSCSNLTFLHGPRICIGEAFARAQLRCNVAAMVLNFELEMANPGEEKVPYGVFTARPENGMPIKIKKRSRNT